MIIFPTAIPIMIIIKQERKYRNLVVNSYCVLDKNFLSNFNVILHKNSEITKTTASTRINISTICNHIHLYFNFLIALLI